MPGRSCLLFSWGRHLHERTKCSWANDFPNTEDTLYCTSGVQKKKFFHKGLTHLKTSVSRHSNFRYRVKFPCFNMEEQFEGQVKEATWKHRGEEDRITINRCQTLINQNLHCIETTIKMKQQHRMRNVKKKPTLGAWRKKIKDRTWITCQTLLSPSPVQVLAFLSGFEQTVHCLSIGKSRITAGIWWEGLDMHNISTSSWELPGQVIN